MGGNDSRCQTGSQATCIRLSKQGADCRWNSAEFESGSGACLGNDSRCSGSSSQTCTYLTAQGTDCKWRASFSVTGSLGMACANAQAFVGDRSAWGAVREALANVTGVLPEYIDIDILAEARRLRGRSLSDANNLRVTYAIVVGGDAPEKIEVTGAEVGQKLQASNIGSLQSAVATSIDTSLGSESYIVTIATVDEPDVVQEVVSTSPMISSSPQPEVVSTSSTTSSSPEPATGTSEQASENETSENETSTPSLILISSTTLALGEASEKEASENETRKETSTSLFSQSSTLGTTFTTTLMASSTASSTPAATSGTTTLSVTGASTKSLTEKSTSTTSTDFDDYQQLEEELTSGAARVFGFRALQLAALLVIAYFL